MTDCVQLVIMKALTTHLEAINNIPVYNSGTLASLAGKVYRGRTVFSASDEGPFLSILEAKKPDDLKVPEAGSDYVTRYEPWHLLLQGFMPDDPNNPTDGLYNFKALVENRLALIVAEDQRTGQVIDPVSYRLGGLIADLRYAPGVVRAASQTTGQVESFFLPVVLFFAINLADTFTPQQ